MKKFLLIAVLIAAMLSVTAYVACIATPLLGKTIKGSGNIVTKTVPAPDFDGLEAESRSSSRTTTRTASASKPTTT